VGRGVPRITERRAVVSAESSDRNPYLFVVGCPRSGTTLLQRMLDHHPRLAVANDSHFIPRAVEDVAVGTDPPLTSELVEWVRTYRRFYRLDLPDAAVQKAARESSTYREFVSALYYEYGRLRGKPLAGEKTPGYVRHLPRLHALFPWARTIHIIRDGRDVYLSTINWGSASKIARRFSSWDEDPVTAVALWWELKVRLGREDGGPLGSELYQEVRYESLVSHPEQELAALCEFLGLSYDDAMLRFHEGRQRAKPGLDAKKAWLPATPGLRDWRSQMPSEDIERFEAAAGELLDELGYPRAVPDLSGEMMENATRIRASFARDILARGEQLPEVWKP
jgi:Sulfotransferase family